MLAATALIPVNAAKRSFTSLKVAEVIPFFNSGQKNKALKEVDFYPKWVIFKPIQPAQNH